MFRDNDDTALGSLFVIIYQLLLLGFMVKLNQLCRISVGRRAADSALETARTLLRTLNSTSANQRSTNEIMAATNRKLSSCDSLLNEVIQIVSMCMMLLCKHTVHEYKFSTFYYNLR